MKKILIVDDNESNRFFLRALIDHYAENHGELFSIHEANNGEEATKIVQAIDFHLIFMDIMMPIMNGMEATKQIHKHHPNVKIIAVSAVNKAELKQQIMENGAVSYISKPIETSLFMKCLEDHLHSSIE